MKSLCTIALLKGEECSQRRTPQKIQVILAAICPLVFVFLVVVPDLAAQTIVPVSQTRTVQARTNVDNWSNFVDSAVGFGVFDAHVQSPDASALGQGYAGHGDGIQHSEILDTSIIASGSASGGGIPVGIASGSSTFSVTFDLATPCLFTLDGSIGWSTDVPHDNGPFVSLTGPGGTVFQTNFNYILVFFISKTFSTNGLLQSGEYVLSAGAGASYYHSEMQSFGLNFGVVPIPEPATCTLLALSIGALLGLSRLRGRSF